VVNKKLPASEVLERMTTEIQNAVVKTQEVWADFSRGLISCCERLAPDVLDDNNRQALQLYIDDHNDATKTEQIEKAAE
jgi:hypothetical protein